MQIKDICKGVTYLPLPLMRVKGRVKVVTTFDIAFDSNQRCSKAITYLISTLTRVKGRSKMLIHLTSPLIRIKGICKGVTSLTYYLMRIKCGVKAVITFDHTFDTNQRKSKSIFSCSEENHASQETFEIVKEHTFNVHPECCCYRENEIKKQIKKVQMSLQWVHANWASTKSNRSSLTITSNT